MTRTVMGVPWGEFRQVNAGSRRLPTPYATAATRLGALAEKALEEFPVLTPDRNAQGLTFAKDVKDVPVANGAVVPIWLTVKVPANVGAGVYTGTVRIEAEGEKAVTVPLEVHVADCSLPNTEDFRTFVDMIECPDTSALEYGVPLWSEKHWGMIADAFRVIGETGSRTVYIPLIAHTDLGNEETMVRWIKKGENKYDYDFSIMERYLDTAIKNMGKPKMVVLVVWDVYMVPSKDVTEAKNRQQQMAEWVQKTAGSIGGGPKVTVLDPATQKTEVLELPPHEDTTESKALWKPVMDGVMERLKKRGLAETVMMGMQCDAWASKEEHQFFRDIMGDYPWILQSHEGFAANFRDLGGLENKLMYGTTRIGYQARVWAATFSDDGADRGSNYKAGMKSHMGWARPNLVTLYDRWGRETISNIGWRHRAESTITGAQRGNGRLGGDYWKVVKDKNGRRVGRSHDRYPESTWRNLFIPEGMLAPGQEGPVASDQLEAYREGVQECEARIVIEGAIYNEENRAKLGEDLAKRCEDYIDNRHMMMWLSLSDLQLFIRNPGSPTTAELSAHEWRGSANTGGNRWFLGSGWQERTEQLFELAGEVDRNARGK